MYTFNHDESWKDIIQNYDIESLISLQKEIFSDMGYLCSVHTDVGLNIKCKKGKWQKSTRLGWLQDKQ